jgi:hypothetical protein
MLFFMKKNCFRLITAALCLSTDLNAQFVINEVSNANVSAFQDEDGDQEDWIEFYNASSAAMNIGGYTISREEEGKTVSWKFPSMIVKPNSYLTVFCSGKNRNTYFDHWEIPIQASDTWKYYLGVFSSPPANWCTLSFNDGSWLSGAGGIGYGDGDDSTVTPTAYSVFMRKSFYVADTSIIPMALLLLDYDDGFVAYLNDVEIARANIGVYGDRPSYNVCAYNEHEATSYQTGDIPGSFFVSPELIDRTLKPGVNVLSIQVHNYASGMNDLSAIPNFLIGVNDTTVTYFPFPAHVNLHTNFKLDSRGQVLTLKDASGNIVDQQNIGEMQMNNSYGKRPDGRDNWYYFDVPSPDTSNNTSAFFTNYSGKPVFSLPAGFYDSPQTTDLITDAGIVRYTLDGSDPTESSAICSGPVLIDSTMVIKARVYSSDASELPGQILINTYFINEDITLPVVSLTSDPYNLFDHNYGIYVMGPDADPGMPYHGANFWKGWERPANIEYFDQAGHHAFEISSSIAIQGNYSKAWPQRGFFVRTSDNYKGQTVDYPLFPDKPVSSYKSFNIRNAGSDWNTCHMRDRFNQKNAQKYTHIDMMDGRPCVLFINGKYWGVYELREKQDENYIENNSGIPEDRIDFLQFNGSIIQGSNKAFLEMVDFISDNDMTLDSNYNKAKSILDIENFCDYFITQTYIVNYDWLGSYTNNIKFWRPSDPPGKWRYVLWDTDLSMGYGQSWGSGTSDEDHLNKTIDPPTDNPHSSMLKSLLENAEFRDYFVNRYADLMNTMFQPAEMRQNANKMRDEMHPEMERHFNRWGNTSPASWVGRSDNVPEWEAEIESMLAFNDSRLGYARDHVQDQFGLAKQVELTLDVSPAAAGKIKISTISPGSFPWTGVYFDGVPVTITAIANPGYEFNHWSTNMDLGSNQKKQSLTINIDSNDTFMANFNILETVFSVYPNPFDNSLTINYQLKKEAQVGIKLYTMIGQEVAEIISPSSFREEGSYSLDYDLNALELAQGVYFIEFKTRDHAKVLKLIRAKIN